MIHCYENSFCNFDLILKLNVLLYDTKMTVKKYNEKISQTDLFFDLAILSLKFTNFSLQFFDAFLGMSIICSFS